MYVVSKAENAVDENGKSCECWYVHMKGFNYVPVFGSFGSYQHARKICKMMNGSKGK